MSHVATLIAGSGRALSNDALATARAVLPGAADPVWLDAGIAADLHFEVDDEAAERALREALRQALAGRPIDFAVQPVAHRRKLLFVADMDSTMIEQECIDELADFIGVREHVAAITERAMRGEIAFAPALRERVGLLKGLPVAVIDELIRKKITLTPGGRTVVATMRRHGAHTCLVSGGFSQFTRAIAAMIGFDDSNANSLVVRDGKLTGEVQEPILGPEAKLEALLEFARHFGLPLEYTMAVGDGANDVAMIRRAGLGVAFHAKPAVAAVADACIDHGDLTALLYLQGYKREEFVE